MRGPGKLIKLGPSAESAIELQICERLSVPVKPAGPGGNIPFASIRGSSRGLIFEWNYGLIAVPFKEAGVAKLADAPDLGSGGAILRGSSPLSGIQNHPRNRAHPRRYSFALPSNRRPDPMHIVMILECLQKLAYINALLFCQVHPLFRQMAGLAGDDRPPVLA